MNLLELSGQTPLVKITERVYAKLETYNPTGSVKDRLVHYLVEDGIVKGDIIPGVTTMIEATSGNTGISLCAVGASLGLPVKIIIKFLNNLLNRIFTLAFFKVQFDTHVYVFIFHYFTP